MYRYAVFVILISIMLSACQKEQQQETTLDTVAETTSAIAETSVQKDISAYEDRTALIPDSTKDLIANPIFVFSLIPDADSRMVTIDELYRSSVSVVRGTITDHTYQSGGTIFYSFGVSEVLYGEQIEPETIITVCCEQGITPLTVYKENYPYSYPQFTKEEADRTYVMQSCGEPYAEIGEEYILFLSDGHYFTANDITGNWYYTTYGYAGKFKLNEDGLYERTLPEFLTEVIYKHETIKADFEPLGLEELKELTARTKDKTAQKQPPEKPMSEANLNSTAGTETVTKNDSRRYEDHTAKISNTFHVNMENAILVPAIMSDAPGNPETYVYDTIDDLYCHSDNIVRGKIIDLTYQSDGHYKGTTYYSLAVSEVLGGEQIEPETIISVQEDKQGYLPLKLFREQVLPGAFSPKYEGEEENRAYLVDTMDKPFARIGEEYVFFLSAGSPSEDVAGNYYSVTSGYGGKFKLNKDGLYERAVPEIMRGLLSQFTEPLSLEELKEQINEAEKKESSR